MRPSLPVRIFLAHLAYTLVFALGAGAVSVRFMQHRYEEHAEKWQREVETLGAETLFQPFANEVGRSLLLQTAADIAPEVRETVRSRVSQGLGALLNSLPSIRRVVVVDRERRIQYSSDPSDVDLGFTGESFRQLFATSEPLRRVIDVGGQEYTQLVVPVFDEDPEVGKTRTRLGSVLVVYEPDPALLARQPQLVVPDVYRENLKWPLVALIVAVAFGSLFVAAASVRPVRRLERALEEFRARGFRGGLRAGRLAQRGELAATVRAISELGGRLEALDEQSRERDALLETLSQALEDGMVAIGPNGTPQQWNPAALRILSPGVAGTDGAQRIREALDRNPGLSGGSGSAGETRLRLPGGSTSPAKVTRLPFETRPGEIGTLLLVRDLAALQRVETHLLDSSRYAVLAHLAGGLAHEIRNPLHSIGINAGVVEQYIGRAWDERSRAVVGESVASIRDECRRLTSLLNNYLGMLRPERAPQPVDLRELCRRVIQLLRYTAGKSGVRLTFEDRGPVPLVRGSADRLQQAILNLTLNAIQAMPDGGRVALEAVAVGDAVRVSVTDTGPGVPRELGDQLFNIRVTTKEGGTGLGLPLVRLIAENHGGSIEHAPRNGGGSRFTLAIPVSAAAPPQDTPAEVTPAARP